MQFGIFTSPLKNHTGNKVNEISFYNKSTIYLYTTIYLYIYNLLYTISTIYALKLSGYSHSPPYAIMSKTLHLTTLTVSISNGS